jgi:hypothetical protein
MREREREREGGREREREGERERGRERENRERHCTICPLKLFLLFLGGHSMIVDTCVD